MRPSFIVAFALMALLAAAGNAFAQGRLLEKAEPPPPPPMVQDNETPEPQVTIRKKQGETVAEYRINNRLYMIKVTRDDGKTFYLIDERGDGQFIQRDSLDTGLRVPMWVIKSW
jgi:hypothetical protein